MKKNFEKDFFKLIQFLKFLMFSAKNYLVISEMYFYLKK